MIATTRMFGKPVFELAQLKEAIATYTSRAAEKLRRQSGAARLIHVFVVTNDYSAHNYNYNPSTKGLYTTLPIATSLTNQLIAHAIMLIEKLYKKGSRYLKAGVMLTDIVPDTSIQYNLFEPPAHDNLRSLMHAIDNINFGMRDELVKFATSGTKKNWKMRQEHRSLRHTTRWDELYEIH